MDQSCPVREPVRHALVPVSPHIHWQGRRFIENVWRGHCHLLGRREAFTWDAETRASTGWQNQCKGLPGRQGGGTTSLLGPEMPVGDG